MRGIESFSSVERSLSKGKRDQDLESVQILPERRNLHAYLEKTAKLAFRGECAAQKRMNCALSPRAGLITQEVPKHGESQWQKDHWKAKDAQKGARKTQSRLH